MGNHRKYGKSDQMSRKTKYVFRVRDFWGNIEGLGDLKLKSDRTSNLEVGLAFKE